MKELNSDSDKVNEVVAQNSHFKEQVMPAIKFEAVSAPRPWNFLVIYHRDDLVHSL